MTNGSTLQFFQQQSWRGSCPFPHPTPSTILLVYLSIVLMQLFVELHSKPKQNKMTSFKKTTVIPLLFTDLLLEFIVRRKKSNYSKCQLRNQEYKVYFSCFERISCLTVEVRSLTSGISESEWPSDSQSCLHFISGKKILLFIFQLQPFLLETKETETQRDRAFLSSI